ncbi:MAG: hypothetical protein JWP59_4704 [Massilia sp.]|jgi:hypothetical protein|nr:hypothetical protein [Massilia sp.]
MDYNPIDDVIDEALFIDAKVMEQLKAFRLAPKLQMLPGDDVDAERQRLSAMIDALTARIIEGIEAHPRKLWVMREFQQSLELMDGEDTEGREHAGMELEQVMDILGIESSDGLLAAYLGGI